MSKNNIQKIYEYLESNLNEISNNPYKVKKELEEQKKELNVNSEEKKVIEFEESCLQLFCFYKTSLEWFKDKKGKVAGELKKVVTEEMILYLKRRVSDSNSSYLKGNYALIIYACEKHTDNANRVFNNYYDFCELSIDTSNNQKFYFDPFQDAINRAYYISKKVKLEKDNTINELFEKVLSQYQFNYLIKPVKAIGEILITEKFDEIWLTNHIERIFNDWINLNKTAPQFKDIYFLEMLSDISSISYNLRISINKTIADLYIVASEYKENSREHFLEQAIKRLNMGEDYYRAKMLVTELSKASKATQLGLQKNRPMTFTESYDKEKQNALITSVLEGPIEETIMFLAFDHDCIPPLSQIVETELEQYDFMPMRAYDENGNFVKGKPSELGARKKVILAGKSITLVLPILQQSVDSRKLDKDKFSKILKHKSWLSKTNNFDEGSIDFFGLIIEALWFLIESLCLNAKDEEKRLKHILVTNLLSVKLEGVIRILLNGKNEPTMYYSRKREGQTQERNLNNFLNQKEIEKYFSTDDLTFFRFVFTNQLNLNLRNRIAHGFMSSKAYEEYYLGLIFVVYLKVLLYNQNPNKPTPNLSQEGN